METQNCLEHGQSLILVCGTCNTTVCPECIASGGHTGHAFQSIESAYKKIRSKLEKADERHANVIHDIEQEITDIPAIRQRLNTASTDATDAISSKSRKLKSNIDLIVQKMSALCLDQGIHLQSELAEREIILKESLRGAASFRDSVCTLLRCENKLDVIKKGKTLLGTQIENTTLSHLDPVVFTHQHDDMSGICDMIGQVEIAGIPIPNPFDVEKTSDFLGSLRRRRELKLKTSFRHSQTAGVLQTCASVTDHAVLVCWAEHVISCVDKSGKVLRSVHMKTQASSISYDNGVIFVASFLEKRVFQFDPTDTLDTLFETDLHPHGMCCFPNNTLLVTLLEHGDHNPSESSQRLLTKFTLRGKQVITVERDNHGKRLFNWPLRVRKNHLNNLAVVVNETGTESSHMVFFDDNLSYKQRYLGKGKVVCCDQAFNPEDIIRDFYVKDVDFDSQNNIFIAEYHSKSVHLLDTSCTRLKSIATFPETIWSLAIHQNNDIWIGFENGFIKIMRNDEDS